MPPDSSRRQLLTTISVSSVGWLAGCGAGTDGSDAVDRTTNDSRSSGDALPSETTEVSTDGPAGCKENWDTTTKWRRTLSDRAGRIRWSPTERRLYVRTEENVSALTPEGEQVWRRPLARGNVVYWSESQLVLNDVDRVVAFSFPSLDETWSFSVDTDTDLQTVSLDDRLYVLATKFPNQSENFEETFVRLYSLEMDIGDVVWRLDDVPQEQTHWKIHAAGGTVFLHDDENYFLTVRPDKSTVRRQYPFGERSIRQWGPVSGGTIYLTTFDDRLYAVSVPDGTVRWQHSSVTAVVDCTGDFLILASEGTGRIRIFALDTRSKAVQWETSLDGQLLSQSLLSKGIAYLSVDMPASAGTDRSRLYAVEASTGCRIGYHEADGAPPMRPIETSSSIYWPIAQGDYHTLHSLNSV